MKYEVGKLYKWNSPFNNKDNTILLLKHSKLEFKYAFDMIADEWTVLDSKGEILKFNSVFSKLYEI